MHTTVNRHSEVVHPSTTISIDAMGGDLGPTAVIAGIVRAAKKKCWYTLPFAWSK